MKTLKIYSLRDVARLLGCDARYVAYVVRDRGIPHGKIGKCIAIDADGLAEVRAALHDHRSRLSRSAPVG